MKTTRMMPIDHDQAQMWRLSADRRSVRMELPGLPVDGIPKPLKVTIDFDAGSIDQMIERLLVLWAQMLPSPPAPAKRLVDLDWMLASADESRADGMRFGPAARPFGGRAEWQAATDTLPTPRRRLICLKIRFPHGSVGSSPTGGTAIYSNSNSLMPRRLERSMPASFARPSRRS
jgi:hypothetical protein